MYNVNGITAITGVNAHKTPKFVHEYIPNGRRKIYQPKKSWRQGNIHEDGTYLNSLMHCY